MTKEQAIVKILKVLNSRMAVMSRLIRDEVLKFLYHIVCFSICSVCSANTLINIDSYNLFNENIYILSYNTKEGDGTSLFIRLIDNTNTITLEPINYTVGIPFAWYDSVDIYNTNPFASNFGSLSSIEINKCNNDFYLYSWAGMNYDSELEKPIISFNDTMVWGQFLVTTYSIQLINCGTIIHHTPEPSMHILALIGMGMIYIKYRRKLFSA